VVVESYLKTLKKALGEQLDADSTDVTTELDDPSKRQILMERLVKEGKSKIEKAAKVTKGVGDFVDAILSIKPAVDFAIKNIPQAAPAALLWAGVCAGLQVSNHLECPLLAFG
jgi:hypothetical protein